MDNHAQNGGNPPSKGRILLINPPHTAIGSRVPGEHLPPLGLLCIGGPLLDAGFHVELLDAEFGPIPLVEIARRAESFKAGIVMLGHSGSSSAHPTVAEIARLIKTRSPATRIVYGGVFPSFHWEEILRHCQEIDFIVRGEGERICTTLAKAVFGGGDFEEIDGIAFRKDGAPFATNEAPLIEDLDACRTAWELIDHSRYSYWGGKRAVVVQFSRGCLHSCSYCGQRIFWRKWRHRDPVKFAKELAWLHREHGVELINFADELPTGSREAWKAFLEALIAENVNLTLVGSTRACDIVRDADILPLYKKAGVIRFLLGIESYNEKTLNKIGKGSTQSEGMVAIRLLRKNGIIAMATYVVGFEEERDSDYWNSLRHLLRYDPDQIQLVFATPHRWTPFFSSAANREVVETDLRKWDYKHQVLSAGKVPPWRLLLWTKGIEAAMQLRPKALWRTFLSQDKDILHGMRWYTRIGRKVWLLEVFRFIFGDAPVRSGLTLAQFWSGAVAAVRCDAMRKAMIPVGDPLDCNTADDPIPEKLV